MGTDFKAVAAFAVQLGFSLSSSDFQSGSELTEDELERGSGGWGTYFEDSNWWW